MIILGIDCSSSCIGYAALEVTDKIKLISVNYLKPIKTGTIIERLVDTRDKFKKIIIDINPDAIAIEDIIQFMAGKSTAKTIITLTSFNRMISLLSYDLLNKLPTLLSVMKIRHGLKLNKILPKKEEMPALVSKHLKIKFPYQKGKTGKIKIENYDMADAIAVALYQAKFGKFE